MKKVFKFKAKVWIWPGFSGWHFVYVDKKISDFVFKSVKEKKIKTSLNGLIPVLVQVGKSEWQTSLLPHKKEKIYLLSIKADIRKKEKIFDGDNLYIQFKFL